MRRTQGTACEGGKDQADEADQPESVAPHGFQGVADVGNDAEESGIALSLRRWHAFGPGNSCDQLARCIVGGQYPLAVAGNEVEQDARAGGVDAGFDLDIQRNIAARGFAHLRTQGGQLGNVLQRPVTADGDPAAVVDQLCRSALAHA